MNRENEFRPRLSGVVARDLSLSRETAGILRELLLSVGTLLEDSLRLDGEESEARGTLERLSHETLEEARLLGELTLALGVTRRGKSGAPTEDPLSRARAARRRRVERYESLMGCTGDRVVRSVLSRLIMLARR